MLIGICGAKCAGKSTVAQFLIEHHGFRKLHIEAPEANKLRNGVSEGDNEDDVSDPSSSTQPKQQQQQQGAAPAAAHVFPTAQALLDFVTKRWRERWVTTDIRTEAVLDALSRRPFFLLISVDAPVTVRWRRWQEQERRRQQQQLRADSEPSKDSSEDRGNEAPTTTTATMMSLEEFVAQSDAQLYAARDGALTLMGRAAVRLLNTAADRAHLYATLAKLDLADPDRLRPSWDSYFMALAGLAARRCNCMKRAVGCVLVDARHRVLSTGYNGTPRALRNCGDGGCPRCNDGGAASGAALATCLCLHAEENALLEAGRERIRPGSVLYCNTCPCLTCSIKIVQVGIGEVVYNQGYSMDGEAAEVFRSAGVKLRQFSPPANGMIHLEKMDLY